MSELLIEPQTVSVPFCFNELLKNNQIDLKSVILVRHADKNFNPNAYDLWMRKVDSIDLESFDLYQSIQPKGKFKNKDILASFVSTPQKETLFVGLYKIIKDEQPVNTEIFCPVRGGKYESKYNSFYHLEKMSFLAEYEGRITVNWVYGDRNWCVSANPDKHFPIFEIRNRIDDTPFPGFDRFIWKISDMDKLPNSWVQILKNIKGVYLLTCLDTGKKYVGSAQGAEMFYGRWMSYFNDGHGGNKGMKNHDTSGYKVTILEVASSTDDDHAIIQKENIWKEKLSSDISEFGLNCN